jgi:hypothetical protein
MNSADEPGEIIGVASGLQLPDLEPAGDAEPEEEPKAVLFVSADVDPNDILDGIQVVRVSVDVIRDQIQRRT